MELITLAATALTLATPFLIKTGEKIAENIGEEVWSFIKSAFVSEPDLSTDENKEAFTKELVKKLSEDPDFERNLRQVVENAQKQMINNPTQIINNNGTVDKQINIQSNTGNIQM